MAWFNQDCRRSRFMATFTDAPAAIKRTALEEPGRSQMYAIPARKHNMGLSRAGPGIISKLRWCPAYKGVPGNEKAGEWTKLAAEEPGADGVEWLRYCNPAGTRPMLQSPRRHQAGNLGGEVSGCPPLGWRPGLRQ
jgi:hypothetical protein